MPAPQHAEYPSKLMKIALFIAWRQPERFKAI